MKKKRDLRILQTELVKLQRHFIGYGDKIIVKDMLTPPLILLDSEELLELFGAFLLVMIGLELLNTIKIYITEKTVHVEVVLVVGIIAIARKVVVLEPEMLDGTTLLGIAAVIFALTVGYYFVRLAARKSTNT